MDKPEFVWIRYFDGTDPIIISSDKPINRQSGRLMDVQFKQIYNEAGEVIRLERVET